MSTGTMVYKDKRIRVVNVKADHYLLEDGVRDGWYADDATIPGSRMFYPSDMFIFEADPRIRRAIMSDTERDKLVQIIDTWLTDPDVPPSDRLADAILAEFLPEHDKQVKAAAFDEALVASADAFFDGDNAPIINPYRRES